MSKNIRDISFLYDEEPDLDQAWEDLRQKLDKKFPVKKKIRRKHFIVFTYKVAAIFFALMTCALLTNNYFLVKDQVPAVYNTDDRSQTNSFHKNGSPVAGTADIITEKSDPAMETGENRGANALLRSSLFETESNTSKDIGIEDRDETKMGYSRNREINRPAILKTIDPGKTFAIQKSLASISGLSSLDAAPDKKATNVKKKDKIIGFDIGAYYNIGSSLKSIYPVANINLSIAKKSSISLGIGLSSMVSVRNFTPKEFIILNDTANLVQFGVTRNEIKKVTYIDLPACFNYKINEQFRVNMGMQVSFLQDFNNKPEYKTYDFQADLSKVVSPNVSGVSQLTPLHTYAEEYTVKKTNWRFVTGISYQYKDAGIKFQYQRSLTPNYNLFDFDGFNSRKKLSVFTVGVYYQIR